MSNEGVNLLARVIQNRVNQLNDKPPVLDFGTIQTDRSLLTNHFPESIPFGDYVSCFEIPGTITEPIRVFVGWVGDSPLCRDAVAVSPIWKGGG
jgi:hypothetical protein